MNYFEKCKVRIENAKFIDCICTSTFSLMTKYLIDEELVLRKFTHKDSQDFYSISFREVPVPISESEMRYLFELSEKKLVEFDNVKNEEILRDL
jgi:hypothetical protein